MTRKDMFSFAVVLVDSTRFGTGVVPDDMVRLALNGTGER